MGPIHLIANEIVHRQQLHAFCVGSFVLNDIFELQIANEHCHVCELARAAKMTFARFGVHTNVRRIQMVRING